MKHISHRHKHQKGKTTLHNFVLFYLSFFLIFICLFVSFIAASFDALNKRTIQLAEESLAAGLARLETTIENYHTSALSLYNSSNIQMVAASRADSSGQAKNSELLFSNLLRNSINEFGNSTKHMPEKTDLGLILKNGFMFTTKRVLRPHEPAYGTYLSCSGYNTMSEWKQFLTEYSGQLAPSRTYTTIDNQTYRAVTFSLALPLNSRVPSALFYATIRESDLLTMLYPENSVFLGQLILKNADGLILYQSSTSAEESYEHVVSAKGANGLTVTLQISQASYHAEMKSFYLITAIFTVLYIFFGIIMIRFFARRSSKPLQSLMEAASQLDSGQYMQMPTGQILKTAEYKMIWETLSNSGLALRSYEEALTKQAEYVRYYTFATLLEDGPGALQPSELPFPETAFPARILVIRKTKEDKDGHSVRLIVPLVNEILPANSLCYAIHNNIVALLFDIDINTELLTNKLQTIFTNIPCKMVFSEPCCDAFSIHKAYTQADFRLRYDTDNRSESQTDSVYQQPTLSRASIVRFLLSGETEALIALLDEYEASMYEAAGEEALQYAFYSCSSALNQLKNLTGFTLPPIPKYIPCTSSELFRQCRELLYSTAEHLKEYRKERSSLHSAKIIQFINDNISNPDLYIRMVLDQFNISENELQTIVKNESGKTFFDYVEQLRMTKARQLLEETDLSINTISERCGYNSRITLSRAYKRFYGVSPSEHRTHK